MNNISKVPLETSALSVRNCITISLPKVPDPRGSLSYIEGDQHIPFPTKRVYYLYDVPSKSQRGGHSHVDLWQLLIAVSGSFVVTLDDANAIERVTLNSPDVGLIVGPGVWREIDNFSSGSVCLVLASNYYTESDYIRDYAVHLKTFGNAT